MADKDTADKKIECQQRSSECGSVLAQTWGQANADECRHGHPRHDLRHPYVIVRDSIEQMQTPTPNSIARYCPQCDR